MSGDRVAVDTAAVWPDDVDAEEGVVVNWFAREGRSVDEGETLCEIQVEKVSVDVPAPATGELVEIVLGEDDEFVKGDTLAWILPS
jgi:pyruvate/2-oxoglutarate dehydrogenase complex dihydrolipoamide acyltransferase (E2) component